MNADSDPQSPELLIGWAVVFLLSAAGIFRLARWTLSKPVPPDPWDAEIAAEMERDTSTPICHRCLVPHDHLVHFCRDCGAPVGLYTNLLPFPYVFSICHTLRIGTDGRFKRTPLFVAGFFLFSLTQYAVLAPVYWYRFLRNLSRQPATAYSPGPLPASDSDGPRAP